MPDLNGPILPVPSLMLHSLPLWFLVLALFLPRIALIGAWFQGLLVPFHFDAVLAPVVGVIIPRALVLFLIYRDQGLSQWFLIHGVVALLTLFAVTQRKRIKNPKVVGMEEARVYRRRPAMRLWPETPRMFRAARTPLATIRNIRRKTI